MKEKDKLNALLKQVMEIMPTMMLIGMTAKKQGAMFMCSPEKTDDERAEDIAVSVAMMLEQRPEVKQILLAAVCQYMTLNQDDWKKMRDAMESAIERTHTASVNVHLSPEEQEEIKKMFEDGHQ